MRLYGNRFSGELVRVPLYCSQNPRDVLAPPPTTLVRGRTLPEEAGRTVEEALLLAEDENDVLPEDLAEVEGLLPDDGLPLDEGFAVDEGFALVDGELADGAEGFDAGGGVTCATGALPPDERL